MAAVQRFWDFLNTDIKELVSLDTVDGSVDTAAEVFKLAETLQDEDIQDLADWVEQGSSLLDVLTTPEAELIESVLPFAKITTGLLKFYLQKTKKPITYSQSMMALCCKAYTESLISFIKQAGIEHTKKTGDSVPLAKNFKGFELTEQEANEVLVCFQKTEFSSKLQNLMLRQLISAEVEIFDAWVLTERAKWNTHRYLTKALRELPDELNRSLGSISFHDVQAEHERYQSIDEYLSDRIASLPNEQVFDEANPRLSFRDIYVPLEVQKLDQNGNEVEGAAPIQIREWIGNILITQDQQQSRKVLFIQGEAGRGKSVFCRMIADWVREEVYPVFIPILIRLRNLRTLANNLTKTLEDCPDLETVSFVRGDSNWLTNKQTRLFIILDGFDELLLQDRTAGRLTSGGLKDFLQMVADFQERTHHQCLVTGRPLALQGAEQLITQTTNLERVKLLPMRDELRETWFDNWQRKFGVEEVTQFKDFLAACPTDINDILAREPLLLYLLGRLHREQQVEASMFESSSGIQAKVRIYNAAVSWVLEQQRGSENIRLTGLETEDLREILQEAALCVVQSGNETAKLDMVKERFQDSANPIAELLTQSKETTGQSDDKALNNFLTTFYLKPGEGDKRGSIEFTHTSFGEFLFAERLQIAIESWTKRDESARRPTFIKDNSTVFAEVYDLLGYGGMSVEIVEYLMQLLLGSSRFKPVDLFERLHEFYLRWCGGEFIDAEERNLPQEKMRKMRKQNIKTGLRQVDVYAGLNVMILLFKLHAKAWQDYEPENEVVTKPDITFFPCGEPGTVKFRGNQLINQISYADALGDGTFTQIVGSHLAHAKLCKINLSGALLPGAVLSFADLSNTRLDNADLAYAFLIGTNFSRANLTHAFLAYTDCYGANFSEANLDSASLYKADLTRADFHQADLLRADLIQTNCALALLDEARLIQALLVDANLTGSFLQNSDLSSANLYGANLYGANLTAADLHNAFLGNANLNLANLSHADLTFARLSNALFYSTNLDSVAWDVFTIVEAAWGLQTARNMPEELKRRLGLE